jgi:hypothetical protein
MRKKWLKFDAIFISDSIKKEAQNDQAYSELLTLIRVSSSFIHL